MIQFFWKLFLQITHPDCKIRAASIARNVRMEKGVTLGYGSHICASFIGKHTYINKYCLIDKNTVSIGRFCSIAYNVKIGLGNHPINWVSTHPFSYDKKYKFIKENRSFAGEVKGKTIIGNDVWIGANAIILAGVKVGDGAIIGANSFVSEDVMPYAIVIGTPAKEIRKRFDDNIIKKLLDIKWWNLDDDKIKEIVNDFDDPEKTIKSFEKNSEK